MRLTAASLSLAALVAFPSTAFAEDPPPREPVPCGTTDDITIEKKLGNDSQLRQMRSWRLQSMEMVDCAASPVSLKLTYAPSSVAKSFGVKPAFVVDVTYDLETKKTVQLEPPLDARREAADKALKAAMKDKTVLEIIGSLAEEDTARSAVVRANGDLEITLESISGSSPTVIYAADHLAELDLPTSLNVTKLAQVVAFKAVAPNIVEGKTCDLPDRYQVKYDASVRSWEFLFSHKKGSCKGKWSLVIDKASNVSWEKR